VAQRGDITSLCINHLFDPKFSAAMAEALAAGVEVIALKFAVTPRGFGPPTAIPTELPTAVFLRSSNRNAKLPSRRNNPRGSCC
jgi:DNA-binding sugar fermentation-stimulating protein